ncbi:SGS domain-containing protein [Besnoitia besnoiti]|uniref:SGS domain-containing protein n=1 Tax=Besnoitia besnoiti TaxID=94643 RepID=A0A2A9MPL5_BESBE|nr:SGS domain-containing protein [Besnoitia besnoiti]PFH38641.1 SGS domain-containing protein [Besnoitia besnoiti]
MASPSASCTLQGGASSASGPARRTQTPRFEWMQSGERLCLTFFVKHLSPGDVQSIEFKPREFCVRLLVPPLPAPTEGGAPASAATCGEEKKLYVFHIEQLLEEIVPEESKYTLSQTKIEVSLKKKRAGFHWAALEASPVGPAAPLQPIATVDSAKKPEGECGKGENKEADTNEKSKQPMYPSSKKKIDWNQVEKEIDDELKDDDKEGEAALQKLFQQIYANADDDTRRAMIKSYQTSGGTVLSTNWDEVRGKNYEQSVTAPEGQEVRRWTQS